MSAMTTPIPNRRRSRRDVVVVGGGMAGVAAALALAKSDLDVTLVEARKPRPWQVDDDMDLRVVAVAPSSAHLLSELGVWPQVVSARVQAYRHMRVWDAENGAVLDMDAADGGYEALGWIVENRLLQTRTWDALESAGVHVRCPASVESLDLREDAARVTLDDGTSLEASVLVAADGAGSPLRTLAGIDTRGRDYAQRAVVAHVTTERGHADTAWQRFLPGGPLALLPLSDGRSSLVWSLPEAEAQEVLARGDAAFCEAVGVASDFRLGRITAATRRAAFPLRLQLARRYHAGRMVLLGDAAHVVHPLAGQGINLGLRDVTELRDVLQGARVAGRDIGADHVLQRYARRRRSADTLDACSFDALARVYAWRSPALVPWRGLGMTFVDRVRPVKRLLTRHAAGI